MSNIYERILRQRLFLSTGLLEVTTKGHLGDYVTGIQRISVLPLLLDLCNLESRWAFKDGMFLALFMSPSPLCLGCDVFFLHNLFFF